MCNHCFLSSIQKVKGISETTAVGPEVGFTQVRHNKYSTLDTQYALITWICIQEMADK